MQNLTPVLTDAATLRAKLHAKTVGALTAAFPLDLKGRTLELHDVKVHAQDFTPTDEYNALMKGTSLNEPVKGTLVLKGADGKVIDTAKNFTLTHLPFLTSRHTLISDGNEYQVANQLRRKPGVYTQRSDNGELKTVFNLGRGKNFDLVFNENKGTFHLQYGTSNLPLYAVLRGLGVGHEHIASKLGEGVAKENEKEHGHQVATTMAKLYTKLEHPALIKPTATHEEKVQAVKKRYDIATLDSDVTHATLGHAYDKVTPDAMLAAAKKILQVHKGERPVDDTDSLTFKTFHSMDDFIAERIRLTARAWSPKAKMALNGKSVIRDALKPAPFSDSIKKFLTTSSLSAVPTGINPMEILDHSVKVTSLGEGGIPSDRAIPLDARMIHNTQFGALDPIRTPESSHSGVDIRATIAAHRDDKGNLYTVMRNVKTGKDEYIRSGDLSRMTVAFPHQQMVGKVDVFHNGEQAKVDASKVTHQLNHVTHIYSPATTLIPFIHSIQGNRAIMGSKMGTQALPLLEREAPLVQVRSHLPEGHSFEQVYGHMIVPRAPVSGTVAKVDKDYVYIRPHSEKKGENRPPQHILITGHSGAGKSTFAKSLAKQTGLPLHQFDEVPGMAEAMLGSDHAKVHQLQRAAVADGLKNLTTPHIMEGTALLSSPELMQGHRVILMDAPREALLKARLERMVQQALNRGRPADPERRHAKGVALYDHYEPMVAAFRKMPGVEVRAPGYVPTAKEASELVRGVRAKEAEDRPVIEQKKLGPHTFNIEIKKDVGHKAEGQTKAKGTSEDYGHLPGYVGPDGDSLDFFVGNRHDGLIYAYDKQKRLNAKGELDPKAPWKVTDIKFVVGHSPAEAEEFHRNTVKFDSPTVRFANRRFFKDWNHLQRHIDEHHKAEKTSAAKDEKGLVKVPYHQFFPFPSKTYLHHDLGVKAGDTVKEGQRLGESNYTKNGTLALGKNLLVGYMPYYGFNSNDAVVISDACSKKLTSEHMYREVYPLSSQIELNKEKHRMYYGTKYQPDAYGKLDSDGVIKKGSRVNAKEPLVLGLTKQAVMGTDAMLGRISKALAKPYKEVTLIWDHGAPGEVIDVVRTNTQITVLVRTQERMQVGDKLAGRYGNKGVVAKIVPDHEMLQDEQGRPIDLLLTSAGVVSRINPAQVIETAVSKVAEKTGKPIVYDNAAGHNAVKWARDLMQTHGVKDKEHLFDPVLNRKIKGGDGKGVLVGRQFIYKLFKSTDTNFAGHGVGPYDLNEQPLKTGGDDSAKGIGKMEFDALLAHNARNFLREAATVKGQKNDEFWKAVQTGMPLPQPKPSFAFNKFTAMLEGSGIKVDKRGSKMTLLPLTDHDVVKRSAGVIENNKTIQSKNLRPEKGGLFDPIRTGGNQGTLYSHIELHEPIPSPVFKDPVRRLLGLSEKDFDKAVHDHGGAWFKSELQKIDVPKKIDDLRSQMKTAKGPALNDLVKQVKSLEALQKNNMKPHEAYIISKVPVIPPVFRPILPGVRDPSQLMVADANKLYAQLMDSSDTLKRTALESDRGKHRLDVYSKVEELYGIAMPQDAKMQQQKVKGFLATIAGVGTPKGGFFQRKLMRHTQDVSGRGTAVPDANLNMDEVGVPEQMLWQMLDKLIVARLIRKGYPALQAREMVTKKDPTAHQAMLEEAKERPVWINRAPTLHRWGIIAAYAKPVQGKTLRVSPFIETGMNLDYDGDDVFSTLFVKLPEGHSLLVHDPDSWEARAVGGPMAARIREMVGVREGDRVFLVNLADFPHLPEHTTKGHIDFHPVPDGVEVFAYDEATGRIEARKASHWSFHRQREVEIVRLASGREMITDDDPRAVYGLNSELVYQRARPKDSVGMFVPYGVRFDDFESGVRDVPMARAVTTANNAGRLRERMQLNEAAGRVLGTLCGDGWVSSNNNTPARVSLASLDDTAANKYIEDLREFFVAPPAITHTSRADGLAEGYGASEKYTVTSRDFAEFVLPLIGKLAKNKHLPPFFLTAPRDFRLGLLAGLLDTDGSIAVSTGKAKPQWVINFTSVSLRMCQEITWLSKSLGVMATVSSTRTPKNGPCWQVTFSTPELHALGTMPCAHAEKARRFAEFFAGPAPRSDLGGYTRQDVLPAPAPVISTLAQFYKQDATYRSLRYAATEGQITRHTARQVLGEHPELRDSDDSLLLRWIALVDNDTVRWDRVVSFERTGIKEDGYDLTVPGHETFMNVEGVILSNTLQVHVPVTPDAVNDAKNMTMTNLLLSDQQRNRLMAFPQHEAIIGFTHAAKNTEAKGPVKTFKNREDVLSAWRRGDLKMSDAIEVQNTKHAEDTEADNYGLGTPLPAGFSTVTPEAALSYFPPENVTGVSEEDQEEADVPLSR